MYVPYVPIVKRIQSLSFGHHNRPCFLSAYENEVTKRFILSVFDLNANPNSFPERPKKLQKDGGGYWCTVSDFITVSAINVYEFEQGGPIWIFPLSQPPVIQHWGVSKTHRWWLLFSSPYWSSIPRGQLLRLLSGTCSAFLGMN